MTSSRPSTRPQTVRPGHSRLSDWLGFVFFAGVAAYTVATHSEFAAAIMPAIVLELLVAGSFLTRQECRRAIRTPAARVAAYAGTFLVFAFVPIASAMQPSLFTVTPHVGMRVPGAMLWMLGFIASLAALTTLRRSFSIEPAARALITTGPYTVVRHPVYSAYGLTYAGTWFLYPSLTLAIVLASWALLTYARISFEEQVLSMTYPDEYATYRRHVPAVLPRMPRRPRRERLPPHPATTK